jgi:transcriptional regulator with XRE-family HTH domain
MVHHIPLKVAILVSGKRHQDVADKAGINSTKFSHILSGRRQPTKAEKAAIARVLRKRIADVFPDIPDEAQTA